MRKHLTITFLTLLLLMSITLVALAEEIIYLPVVGNTVENGNAVATAAAPPAATPTAAANSLSSNHLDSYTIADTGFGTQVNVVVDSQAQSRTIVSNALPNHETGEFPNAGNPNTISAQDKSWTFTTAPTFVGTATFAREPGVAINGVKFEPDTAERVTCTTGEVHNIEAIQDVTNLGLDLNNAHVQPTGEYHYHGVSALLVDLYSTDQDLVHVAFAADGHLIYYSKSGAYQASYRLGEGAREGTNCTYTPGAPGSEAIPFGSVKDGSLKSDWDYNTSYGQLDECNGVTVNGQYIYLITNEYPYISRCLMGEFTESAPGGGGPPGGGPPEDGSPDTPATATTEPANPPTATTVPSTATAPTATLEPTATNTAAASAATTAPIAPPTTVPPTTAPPTTVPPTATAIPATATIEPTNPPTATTMPPTATAAPTATSTNPPTATTVPPTATLAPTATTAPTATPTTSANTLSSNYLDSYTIADTGFGTQVNVVVDSQANSRTIVSNGLPNHATGEFPNDGNPNTISAQDKSWTYTTAPTFVGAAAFAQEPGVAINGVKFTPDTAERANCTTGEEHNIEAIQDVTDLGLDFNNAHVQPTGEYHYHGVSELLVAAFNSDQDLVHVAFAADGYLIYYSKSGAYQASYRLGAGAREGTNCTYTSPGGGATITFGSVKDGSLKSDWDYNASYGQLDECNGITVNGQYIYLITNDYPYVSRCLMGQFSNSGAGGDTGGGGPPEGGTPPGGGPPPINMSSRSDDQ